jgi:hypothetical protein
MSRHGTAESDVEDPEIPRGEVLLYETPDGKVRVDVRLERETVWLRQEQMARLFGRERSVITKHLRNVFAEGELERKAVCAKFAHTAADGKTYQVEHYNLDVIISVGYRLKSLQGTRFRQWATRVLREHLVRGYTLNERRLAERGLGEAEQAIALLARTLTRRALVTDEGRAVLEVVPRYTRASADAFREPILTRASGDRTCRCEVGESPLCHCPVGALSRSLR